MKQTLNLKLGQSLTMTPQLQQAIRLLQLSTLELQTEIREALDNNPLLEIEESPESGDAETEPANAEASALGENDAPRAENEQDMEFGREAKIPEEPETDTRWEDTYGDTVQDYLPTSASSGDSSELPDFESRTSSDETLTDHLLWQLQLTPFSDQDREIAEVLIRAISSQGYLEDTPEDVLTHLLDTYPELTLEEVVTVLHRVQQFDPAGIGARDLSECLSLQLRQLPPESPWRETALTLVANHLEDLASHNFRNITKALRIPESELSEVVRLVQSLDPKPGARIGANATEYVVPDIIVRRINERWQADLNPDIAPKIRVNPFYSGMIKRRDNSSDNTYLKDHLNEARWFINSLKSRNDTLLRVARCIVERQQAFFDYGDEAMRPMVLHDIADELGMHESTISRVTTKKYMHTPKATFELKYFFSSHVNTESGGTASAVAIKALIRKLIDAEEKPLSDSRLADLLSQDQGIQVARRTVAKYREALNIPPSNERKKLNA
ncbi:MAG: RNA polymerase factor sigma-54 [Gammaproteobacteria bacterium]|nr:RNA polymerase factor sigma-54 [Gammaproteobacteria bacterium]